MAGDVLALRWALRLDVGIALSRKCRAYLVLPLQVQVGLSGGRTGILVPLGFQYDFGLPPRGLYLYPRISLGYAAFVAGNVDPTHDGLLLFDLGLKYVLRERWSLGIEPVGLLLLVNGAGVALTYQLLAYAGVNL